MGLALRAVGSVWVDYGVSFAIADKKILTNTRRNK